MKQILLMAPALTVMLFNAHEASACVCVSEPGSLSAEQFKEATLKEFREAAAVFTGEVIEIDTFWVRLKVQQIWKGGPGEEMVMRTGAQANEDGGYTVTSCDYIFEIGEKYLVFAKSMEGALMTQKCTGTDALKHSEQRIKQLNVLRRERGVE